MRPTTREQFKTYCLRKLGAPVLEINVADEQVEDRIDEALSFYADYHFDGTEKIYYKYRITQTDIDNQYIVLPENIIGVTSIFDFGSSTSSSQKIFDVNYQFALNEIHTITSSRLAPYFYEMTNLSMVRELLNGSTPIRYNRNRNILHLDLDWKKLQVGTYVVVDAYMVLDPTEYADVWGDRWLQNYASAKIKYQWASNLSKFVGVSLPGNVQFNADRMMDEAKEEINKLEETAISAISLPVMDFVN